MIKIRRYSIPIKLIIFATILGFIFAGWYTFPKTMIHPNYLLMNSSGIARKSDRFLLYYYGFDLIANNSFLGKQFYKFRMINEHEITYIYDVTKKEPGHIDFKACYPDGKISIVGQCYMEFQGDGLKIPEPDDTKILSARCYRPDGSLGSEVVSGSGIYTYWNPRGYKLIESTFLNCERIIEKRWYSNGQLQSIRDYQDGSYNSYDKDGNKYVVGRYMIKGSRTGIWTYYNPDGSVDKVENFDDPNWIRN